MKEKSGEYVQAIELYMKGNMPAKASRVVINRKIYQPMPLLESILAALNRSSLYDVAGEFYEYMDDFVRAVDCYERGNAYRKAVELARKCFPARVVELQEKWGDYLVGQRQIDMAINHYIEAKSYQKAIEAALSARQYPRALQLVKAVDESLARPYYISLARYYEDSSQTDLAEKCYLAAGDHVAAVNLHARLGNWEVANKLASAFCKADISNYFKPRQACWPCLCQDNHKRIK
jgi:intraflagellar transport protein 172